MLHEICLVWPIFNSIFFYLVKYKKKGSIDKKKCHFLEIGSFGGLPEPYDALGALHPSPAVVLCFYPNILEATHANKFLTVPQPYEAKKFVNLCPYEEKKIKHLA